jgi:hypothetical protein
MQRDDYGWRKLLLTSVLLILAPPPCGFERAGMHAR